MNTPAQVESNKTAADASQAYRGSLAWVVFTLIALYALTRIALSDGASASISRLAADSDFLRWLGQSTLLALSVAVAFVVIAMLAASSLCRGRTTTRQPSSTAALAAQMFAGAMFSLPLYLTLVRVGELDGRLGAVIVSALLALPLAVWQLKAGYDSIPTELYDVARIDGCSPIQSFYAVTFPAIRRPLLMAVLFCFMTAWNLLVIAALLFPRLGGAEIRFATGSGALAGAALLTSIPLLVFFLALTFCAAPPKRLQAGE